MPSSEVGIMDYANRLPHEEGGASKFRMGGDPRFNIPEVLAQRQKLRESQRLKTASLQFWSVLDKAPGETMSKEEYTHVHQRIARALAPELSAAEAIEACEEDWEEDCGGMESISFEEYADGVRAAVCIRSSWSRLLLILPLSTPPAYSSSILSSCIYSCSCTRWPICGPRTSTSSSTLSSSTSSSAWSTVALVGEGRHLWLEACLALARGGSLGSQ